MEASKIIYQPTTTRRHSILAEQIATYKIDWTGFRTQWLPAMLLALLVIVGIWASVFAQGSNPARGNRLVPVSLRANLQADYSSDPNLSFRPVSLTIVKDILSDELISSDEVSERLAQFEANLLAPIPDINPSSPDGKQASILPSDSQEDEPEVNETNESEGEKENQGEKEEIVFDDDYVTTTPEPDDQPDVLDPNDDPPGNSGNAPGQVKKNENPSNDSDNSPGNSGNAPGQNKDEDSGQSDGSPGNSGDAPGQNKDEDPEQSDDSPGNSGDAPGQNKDKAKGKGKTK